ncbi:MAG: hypothetical protein MUP31_01965 [Xanthomonadales bacterium]|nr:hypothetical protein [Xanthomonadales bacterium]
MPTAMHNIKNPSSMPGPIALLLIVLTLFGLLACESEKHEEGRAKLAAQTDDAIEIVTENMNFKMLDEISSGWHTFRYSNQSDQTHFFLLEKYPQGKTLKDAKKEVFPVFQEGMDFIFNGEPEEGVAAFGNLPPWYSQVVLSGGSGLISPWTTSETTLKLAPGYYVVECYVKMPNGTFHSVVGMAAALVVSSEVAPELQITPDVNIAISSTVGIVFDDNIHKGKQTFSVFFKDQVVHENFVGHDVNLVKYDDGADLKVLEKWMNWANPMGLISPSPEGFTFLGGVNDMPAGSTGYFTAELEPGNYAFVAEVPNSLGKNMLKTFVVGDK